EELRGQVQIDLANDGQGIEVVITDNGRGLPQDFSIQTTTSLGLSIVRDLLQSQLGGTIEMRRKDDELGGGTIVRFTVPLGQER
ncbi:MAG: ATP-binding protein, partial [Actinomycetes bacterium]